MNYYSKLIDFFKRNGIDNDEIFNYIQKKTILIDYTIEEQKAIRGVYPKYDKNYRLEDITLYIDVNNDETILLSIRPYIKAICAYYNLGRAYNLNHDIEAETLAIHYEKLYLKENPNDKSQKYLDNIYKSILQEENNSKHKIALQTQKEIEQSYSNIKSFDILQEKAKTLRKIKSK